MRVGRLVALGLAGGAMLYIGMRRREERERRAIGTIPGEPEGIARARDIDAVQARVEQDTRSGEALEDLDAAALVETERDLLTVPGGDGETHRRRDQTAGVAAQEIAAAQVRARRHGIDEQFEE